MHDNFKVKIVSYKGFENIRITKIYFTFQRDVSMILAHLYVSLVWINENNNFTLVAQHIHCNDSCNWIR